MCSCCAWIAEARYGLQVEVASILVLFFRGICVSLPSLLRASRLPIFAGLCKSLRGKSDDTATLSPRTGLSRPAAVYGQIASCYINVSLKNISQHLAMLTSATEKTPGSGLTNCCASINDWQLSLWSLQDWRQKAGGTWNELAIWISQVCCIYPSFHSERSPALAFLKMQLTMGWGSLDLKSQGPFSEKQWEREGVRAQTDAWQMVSSATRLQFGPAHADGFNRMPQAKEQSLKMQLHRNWNTLPKLCAIQPNTLTNSWTMLRHLAEHVCFFVGWQASSEPKSTWWFCKSIHFALLLPRFVRKRAVRSLSTACDPEC